MPELRSEPRNILLGVIFSSLSAFAISFMDVTYASTYASCNNSLSGNLDEDEALLHPDLPSELNNQIVVMAIFLGDRRVGFSLGSVATSRQTGCAGIKRNRHRYNIGGSTLDLTFV